MFAATAACEPAPQAAQLHDDAPAPQTPHACACERGALQDVARFRATLREAIEARVHEVLTALARDVLARELVLAPPDIGALVARMLDECGADEALEIRLAPHDAAQFGRSCGLPVRVDPQLLPGELAVDARSGTYESHLHTRLTHLSEMLAE